jgi:uncharacterized membrane protein
LGLKSSKKTGRIWELDLLRGIALILMIYFHIIFDMRDIFGYDVEYASGINYMAGKLAGILFILVSGISSLLSRSNIKRGIKLLVLAGVITLVTHIYSPDLGIKFGILHFLGVCIILSEMFIKLNKYLLLMMGTVAIILNFLIGRISISHNYLMVFGIYSADFSSSDYYPLIPWLGVFLYGAAIGKFCYMDKRQSIFKFTFKDNIISKLGRHTLIIYLVHQPAIIGVLSLIDRIKR